MRRNWPALLLAAAVILLGVSGLVSAVDMVVTEHGPANAAFWFSLERLTLASTRKPLNKK